MWTLAFDTTTNFCSIALFEDKIKRDLYSAEMTFGQSEALILQIQNMLHKHGLSVQDLGLMAVCTGPGSFTGVRSSIAATRAFGLTNKKMALCGISAFEAYLQATDLSQVKDCVAVIIETKREDFYVAYYGADGHKLEAPKTALFEDIVHDLQNKHVTIVGDGVQRFLSRQTGLHIKNASFDMHPPVDSLALAAIARFENRTIDFPKPLYLKAADICAK